MSFSISFKDTTEKFEFALSEADTFAFDFDQQAISREQTFIIGSGLIYDAETKILSVDTADKVEQDNTKPVTSAAVHMEIGNIEVLLAAL